MAATRLSWLALLAVATLGLLELLPPAGADYPGVIELVGYSNRRARTHYMPPSYASHGRQLDTPTLAPPPAKTQADIETVKQNIEKYNKLLTLDTRHLPDSQKDMLERIVERVARLKESLDVEHNARQLNQSRTDATTTPTTDATTSAMTDPDADIEAETDPTLVLDETTLLQLQTSMDELAAAQAAVTAQTTRMRELPTTTEFTTADAQEADAGATAATGSPDTTASGSGTGSSSQEFEATTDTPLTDATDADDQFVAARSNNRNIAAITAAEPLATSVASGASASSTPHSTTAGNQRTLTTSGKAAKTRPTKRPGSTSPSTSSSTKAAGSTTSKRVGGQRPGSTASLHKPTTSKQKLAAAAAAALTTAQPHSTHHHSNANTNSYGHSSHKTKTHPKVTEKTPAAPATIASSTASSYAGVGVGGEMAYDSHVNTSAIIDSLNHAREEFYHQKQTVNNNNGPISSTNNKDKKPSATAKPTKYHYYPHNQHIYLLPECAIQQVCNAVYVRLNYTQPLCACPSRYRDPCSASLNEDDQHTTKLVGDGKKKAITLAKTCEATTEMRECRSPKDWSLLALQNTRTGKSHYLVICRCPDHFKMEGPMAHDQPTYASVPGIRVFGMMCVKPGYSARKPSVQPPKRYQLQKPFYRPGSQSSSYGGGSQYGGNKDAYGRPIYGGSPSSSSSMSSLPSSSNSGYHQSSDSFQSQHQANYQYLNRPESSHISSSHKNHNSNNNYHPESISIGNFNGGGIYGRNNERKGDAPIQAATNEPEDEDQKTMVMMTSTSTPAVATEVEARTTHSEEPSAGDNNSSTNTSNNNNSMETTAAEASQAPPSSSSSSSTPSTTEGKREKRSVVEEISELEDDGQMPEFPWDRVIEFQQSIVWD